MQADIHPDFVRRVKEFIAYMRPTLREYQEVFTGNVIARERLKGTGVLTREDAVSFGATGGTGRASGWACDVRKRHPYAMYGKVDFEEVLYDEGDCFARYMVRMREIEQSMNIIEQLIDNIPEGEYQLKMKPVIRIPEGSYYAAVEGSRGEFGVFIESRGEKSPYRMKFRSTAPARVVPRNHCAGDEDRRPDRHRRYAGLRRARYRQVAGCRFRVYKPLPLRRERDKKGKTYRYV